MVNAHHTQGDETMERFVTYVRGQKFSAHHERAAALLAHDVTGAPLESIRVQRRTIVVHVDGGQYVGLLLPDNRPVNGTASNAGLLCRSRCIDAAKRLGVGFAE
jgi:hypothetical protein